MPLNVGHGVSASCAAPELCLLARHGLHPRLRDLHPADQGLRANLGQVRVIIVKRTKKTLFGVSLLISLFEKKIHVLFNRLTTTQMQCEHEELSAKMTRRQTPLTTCCASAVN